MIEEVKVVLITAYSLFMSLMYMLKKNHMNRTGSCQIFFFPYDLPKFEGYADCAGPAEEEKLASLNESIVVK